MAVVSGRLLHSVRYAEYLFWNSACRFCLVCFHGIFKWVLCQQFSQSIMFFYVLQNGRPATVWTTWSWNRQWGSNRNTFCGNHFLKNLWYIDVCVVYFQYNVKEGSVKLAYEPQPRPRAISAFSGKTVVKVACGTNHTGSLNYFHGLFNAMDIYSKWILISFFFFLGTGLPNASSCCWFNWLCLHVCSMSSFFLWMVYFMQTLVCDHS